MVICLVIVLIIMRAIVLGKPWVLNRCTLPLVVLMGLYNWRGICSPLPPPNYNSASRDHNAQGFEQCLNDWEPIGSLMVAPEETTISIRIQSCS